MKYLSLLFLMSCVPNTMHNHILDNKEVTHIYISGCSEDTFIAGYNKDMEEIYLDSNSIDFEKFYIDAQRINNGH